MLTHRFTPRRERLAAEQKPDREPLFVATERIFLPERSAEGCIPPACAAGTPDRENGRLISTATFPGLDYTGVTGDWRALPPRLVYRLHYQKAAGGAPWKLWRRHRTAEAGRLVHERMLRESAQDQQTGSDHVTLQNRFFTPP